MHDLGATHLPHARPLLPVQERELSECTFRPVTRPLPAYLASIAAANSGNGQTCTQAIAAAAAGSSSQGCAPRSQQQLRLRSPSPVQQPKLGQPSQCQAPTMPAARYAVQLPTLQLGLQEKQQQQQLRQQLQMHHHARALMAARHASPLHAGTGQRHPSVGGWCSSTTSDAGGQQRCL